MSDETPPPCDASRSEPGSQEWEAQGQGCHNAKAPPDVS